MLFWILMQSSICKWDEFVSYDFLDLQFACKLQRITSNAQITRGVIDPCTQPPPPPPRKKTLPSPGIWLEVQRSCRGGGVKEPKLVWFAARKLVNLFPAHPPTLGPTLTSTISLQGGRSFSSTSVHQSNLQVVQEISFFFIILWAVMLVFGQPITVDSTNVFRSLSRPIFPTNTLYKIYLLYNHHKYI